MKDFRGYTLRVTKSGAIDRRHRQYPKDLQHLGKQYFFRCHGCANYFHCEGHQLAFRFCKPCKEVHALAQRKAIGAVCNAVKTGRLPPASTLDCVDCGQQAEVYEHRSYSRPLEVEATCQACNIKRGPAMWEAA